jgi:hypothetical protein
MYISIIGYESDQIPTWDNAYTDLIEKGKVY